MYFEWEFPVGCEKKSYFGLMSYPEREDLMLKSVAVSASVYICNVQTNDTHHRSMVKPALSCKHTERQRERHPMLFYVDA